MQKIIDIQRIWVNKSNRVAYIACFNEKKIKCYECEHKNQADFIEFISSSSKASYLFPKIIKKDKNIIKAEWIQGITLEVQDWPSMVETLVEIQQLSITKNSRYDYVENLVIPRFKKISIIDSAFFESVISVINSYNKSNKLVVSHPDITCANIVKCNGIIKIIDNELLGQSKHYIMDILNLVMALPLNFRLDAINYYLKLSGYPYDFIMNHRDYVNALWVARKAGSLLVAGNIKQLNLLINSYCNDKKLILGI